MVACVCGEWRRWRVRRSWTRARERAREMRARCWTRPAGDAAVVDDGAGLRSSEEPGAGGSRRHRAAREYTRGETTARARGGAARGRRREGMGALRCGSDDDVDEGTRADRAGASCGGRSRVVPDISTAVSESYEPLSESERRRCVHWRSASGVLPRVRAGERAPCVSYKIFVNCEKKHV